MYSFIILASLLTLANSQGQGHHHHHENKLQREHVDIINNQELLNPPATDKHHHRGHQHPHHHHHIEENTTDEQIDIQKRDGTCAFPTNLGLVSITPGEQNGGWAMSPNQICASGTWCPFACPPGQLSYQWDPSVTSYVYPGSQYGGFYCNNGQLSQPFPNQPLCKDGTGKVTINNLCNSNVAICQTVLPGNENMLIPTSVDAGSSEVIAVPDPSYWASTAAHYYINPPSVSTQEGCGWGSTANPWGNWSPYVAGANSDANGNTFVKIGWNPVYLQSDSPFQNTMPNFGVRIVCAEGGNCNGLPCEINPSVNPINGVTSPDSADGAGSAGFCVVTAENGASAYIEIFEASGSGSSSSASVLPASAPQASSGSSNGGSSPVSTPAPSTSTQASSSSSSSSVSSSTFSSSSSSTSTITSTISSRSPASATPSTPTATSNSAAPLLLGAENGTVASEEASTFGVSYVSSFYTSRTVMYNIAQGSNATATTNSSSVQVPSAAITSAETTASTPSEASSTTSSKKSGSANLRFPLEYALLVFACLLLL